MTSTRARSYRHASLWVGAVNVGTFAVLYARLISLAQNAFSSWFGKSPYVVASLSPFAFVLLLIGLVGGLSGGVFARILAYPQLTRLPKHWVLRALICGVACASICLVANGATAGSGYEPTVKVLMASSADSASLLFPVYKLITTILSYLSGMAGGIFSPSLSIGAGIGISLAKLFHFPNFRTCALMGMVAFFSGVVQAPLTAIIIVMEMTDRHILILPFMVAAFIGQGIGRLIMPVPLYHFLAKRNDEG